MRHLIIGAALALAWAGSAACGTEPTAAPEPDAGADEVPNALPRPVTVFVAREAQDAGVAVRGATAGAAGEEESAIRLALSFSKLLEARVLLRAYDENNVELGRAKSHNLYQPAGSALDVPVQFKGNLRLGGIHHCNMELIPRKAVVLSGDAAGPAEVVKGKDKEPLEVSLGRMRDEVGPPVRASLEVLFGTAFRGELQLRAHDASGTEVGRTQKSAGIDQAASSRRTFEFQFHETLSAASVESYELFVRAEDPPKTKKKRR